MMVTRTVRVYILRVLCFLIYLSTCVVFFVSPILKIIFPLCLGQVVASGVGLMFNLFVSVDLVHLFDTRVYAILYGLNFNFC